jgi:hypothetical protein
MNKVLLSLLFSAFILTGISFAQAPVPAEAPVAPAAATMKPAHHMMHNPEIHKAIRKLRGAKEDLEKAAHDFGGHKAKAIAAINGAIAELQAAIDFEKSK